MTAAPANPIGTPARDAANRRARNPEYQAERERLAFWADIAAQIILFRTRRGLTQEQLAHRIGTSYSATSRLESGQHAVSGETLRRVAQALGLHLRFEETEPSTSPPTNRKLARAA